MQYVLRDDWFLGRWWRTLARQWIKRDLPDVVSKFVVKHNSSWSLHIFTLLARMFLSRSKDAPGPSFTSLQRFFPMLGNVQATASKVLWREPIPPTATSAVMMTPSEQWCRRAQFYKAAATKMISQAVVICATMSKAVTMTIRWDPMHDDWESMMMFSRSSLIAWGRTAC